MSQSFVFVTGNKGKLDRMKLILGDTFESAKLDLEEIQSMDSKEIAGHKAKQAFEHLAKPVLVEDTSLHIDSLGGLPGSFIKWFLESVGPEGICSMVTGERSAKSINTYAFYDGSNMHYFIGEVAGTIAIRPKGSLGFGWDSIFVLDGEDVTRAEMDQEEVAARSGRAIAMQKFKEFLEARQN